VSNEAAYGAIGTLIYEDPRRVAPPESVNFIYPNGEFMPPDGLQLGSIIGRYFHFKNTVKSDLLAPGKRYENLIQTQAKSDF
jgi:hypothetical protein